MDMKDDILALLQGLDGFSEFEYATEDIAKTGDHPDSLCIFYNTKHLKVLKVNKDNYRGVNNDNKSNRVYLMMLFEHIGLNKKFIVGTMHLKSKKPNRKIRVLEITEYLLRLKQFLNSIKEDKDATEDELEQLPIIITGDFNDEPDSSVVESMTDVDLTYGIKFNNVYCIDGKHPEFTTHKYRSDKVTSHTIDYMFHNEHVKLISLRNLPDESQIPESSNPCEKCPSDHLSLSSTFQI